MGVEVWGDGLVVVSHAPVGGALGYLFVETRRHAVRIEGLTDAEAAAVGVAASRAARGLVAELGVERVHTAVVGTGAEHFHLRVFCRYPGTPADWRWDAVDEWPGVPRAEPASVTDLCGRLLPYFG